MSLRTRLILAFLLLSVVPLSAVTLYSYSTSVDAFQRATEREAAQSASDIGHRMAMVTDDLGRRMDLLFEESTDSNAIDAPATSEQVRARLGPMLGGAAALVDRGVRSDAARRYPHPASPDSAPLLRRASAPSPESTSSTSER
jgi:hypothetical protein